MNSIKQRLTYLLTGIILVSITSCSVPSSTKDTAIESVDEPTTITESLATDLNLAQSSTTQEQEQNTSAQQDNTTVTVYQIDNQCNSLVPEKVAVSKTNTIEAAVGKVLDMSSSSDFDVAGYRINVNSSGLATVDMRLAPNSKRQFVSLSSCEQFAIFGSLRKTLTENSQWQVRDVVFTEQGQEIFL